MSISHKDVGLGKIIVYPNTKQLLAFEDVIYENAGNQRNKKMQVTRVFSKSHRAVPFKDKSVIFVLSKWFEISEV